ncbi:MAG: nucleoside deaminase [Clostridia bacterium]|nr:nucleoside deaminase [Clostridia bacterium]
MSSDEHYMRLALTQALAARAAGEVPVGAVIARHGCVVAEAHNEVQLAADGTAHAELLAIRRASEALGSRSLDDCCLYVTLEPCAMCAGACLNARVGRVVYGAFDPQYGCVSSRVDLLDALLTCSINYVGGILEAECAALLHEFFDSKR